MAYVRHTFGAIFTIQHLEDVRGLFMEDVEGIVTDFQPWLHAKQHVVSAKIVG